MKREIRLAAIAIRSMISNMNITGIQQTTSALTAGQSGQSNQDSHEISIQKQILTLQEKMRGITYDKEMSAEEKSDEKKDLQEKIQNLNSELKQYQLQKRQKEAEKKQQEAARQKETEERATTESTTNAGTDNTAGKASENVNENNNNMEEQQSGQTNADVMFSISGTKEHLADMQQIRTKLEGQMRTASTAKEKAKLQEKIDEVSKKMGEKVRKVSDTIEDTQKEEKSRKEKVKKLLQEFRDKRKNMNAAVSKTADTAPTGSGYWKDGKVLLTRKKS